MKIKLLFATFFISLFIHAQSPFMTGYLQVQDITTNSCFVLLQTSVIGGNSNYNVQYSTVSAADVDVSPTNSAIQTHTPALGYSYVIFNLTNLAPNTRYFFRIRATAVTGFVYTSNYSFVTTAAAPSGTFPQVFNFDNSMKNAENSISFQILKDNSFTQDRHGNATGAVILPGGAGATITNIPVGSAARSISIWLKPTAFATDNLLFVYGNQSGESCYGFSFSNTIIYNFAWNTNVPFTTSLPLNQWTHIVTTYDAAKNAKIYVNGALVATQNRPNWNTTVTDYFALSPMYSSNRRFIGAVDDLQIFNTALLPTEVSSLYTTNALSSQNFNQNNLQVALYPNPTSNILNIEMTNELKSVEIYNIQGQKVKTSNQKQINVADLAAGMYMIKIQDIENSIATKKFVKQ